MQGASPLASPELDRLRHLFALPLWKTQWGLSLGGTGSTCRCGARGGGLPFWSPAAPAFSLFVCPLSPQPPSPAGKGETKVISCKGLRPLHPGIKPPAALARPATAFARRGAVSCRACFACRINAFLPPIPPDPLPRRGRGRPKLFFARGFAPCIPGAEPIVYRKNGRKRFPMSRAGSQGEGGPGERNFGV